MAYRIIPFRNIHTDTLNKVTDLFSFITSQLASDKVLVQDSEDMIVEAFTDQQLDGYHDCGVFIEGLHIDKYLFEKTIDDTEFFLNGALKTKIKFKMKNNAFEDVKKCFNLKISSGDVFMSAWYSSSLVLDYLGNLFSINLDYIKVLSDNELKIKGVVHINDKVFCTLDTDVYSASKIALSLVQICKVKDGFEFVISLCGGNVFIGFKLSDDLELIYITNIDKLVFEAGDDFKQLISKSKLMI